MDKCSSGKNCSLIKKLAESGALNCQSCRNLLQIPVFLVAASMGNVCAKCYAENDGKGIENGIFNMVLRELTILCVFAEFGCCEEIPYENCQLHFAVCKYRRVNCLRQECKWVGKQNDIPHHFMEDHKENVIKGDTFQFELDRSLVSTFQTQLLVKGHTMFLIAIEQEKNDVRCSLFKFHPKAACTATIDFCNSNGDECSFKLMINPVNSIDDQYSKLEVDLTTIGRIFEQDLEDAPVEPSFSLIVNIPPNEQLVKSLQCISCSEIMRPPIYQCLRGHTVCNDCVGRLKTCPKCSAFVTRGIRNFFLEETTSNVLYPCVYKASGCDMLLSGDEVMAHEANCLLQPSKCPINDCAFQYNAMNIVNHLNLEHVVTNEFEFDCQYGCYSLPMDNSQTFMYIDGRFFRFNYVFCNAKWDEVTSTNQGPKYNGQSYPMQFAKLEFSRLSCNKSVDNLYCKSTMVNPKTQTRITHYKLLKRTFKIGECYSVFVPIEAFSDAIDVTREAVLKFKCELLMT